MFRFISITLQTFPCLLYCLTTHETLGRYGWGSGVANSLKVWKVFRKTLRGFWSNIHLLQIRRLKWVLFMVPLRCCFDEKKKKVDNWWPLYQWFQNKKYLNILGILKNVNSFRNFPYLKTPVGLLIPQTNHCLALSKKCQTRF